jgi:hypothetical protein
VPGLTLRRKRTAKAAAKGCSMMKRSHFLSRLGPDPRRGQSCSHAGRPCRPGPVAGLIHGYDAGLPTPRSTDRARPSRRPLADRDHPAPADRDRAQTRRRRAAGRVPGRAAEARRQRALPDDRRAGGGLGDRQDLVLRRAARLRVHRHRHAISLRPHRGARLALQDGRGLSRRRRAPNPARSPTAPRASARPCTWRWSCCCRRSASR